MRVARNVKSVPGLGIDGILYFRKYCVVETYLVCSTFGFDSLKHTQVCGKYEIIINANFDVHLGFYYRLLSLITGNKVKTNDYR